MKSSMTIGQYYPVSSRIHSLDARVKLITTLVYIAVLFVISNVYGYVFVMASLAAVIYASRVPVRFMLKGLKGVMMVILFTALLNMFFTPGETVAFSFYGITVMQEGIFMMIKMVLRIAMLITGSSVLTLTTTPIELSDALEYLLKPFKRIGLPAHELTMMMTVALRFIPDILEEMDKIMKAQMARGASFDTGGLIKRAKALLPLLVPLFVSAFRRALELAMAMESRCYRGDYKRTKLKQMKMKTGDIKASVLLVLFTAASIGLSVL